VIFVVILVFQLGEEIVGFERVVIGVAGIRIGAEDQTSREPAPPYQPIRYARTTALALWAAPRRMVMRSPQPADH